MNPPILNTVKIVFSFFPWNIPFFFLPCVTKLGVKRCTHNCNCNNFLLSVEWIFLTQIYACVFAIILRGMIRNIMVKCRVTANQLMSELNQQLKSANKNTNIIDVVHSKTCYH